MDILFSINVASAIGDHDRVLKEGRVLLKQVKDEQQNQVTLLMWLSAVAMGEADPSSTISLQASPKPLQQALILYALFNHSRRNNRMIDSLHEKIADNNDDNALVKYILAKMLVEIGDLQAAFDMIKREHSIECSLLIVIILAKINRLDAAQVRLELLKRTFGDDPRLQMIEAGVVKCQSLDEKRVKDALYTFQELAQVNGQTGVLSLYQAVCLERFGRFQEALDLINAAFKNVNFSTPYLYLGIQR